MSVPGVAGLALVERSVDCDRYTGYSQPLGREVTVLVYRPAPDGTAPPLAAHAAWAEAVDGVGAVARSLAVGLLASGAAYVVTDRRVDTLARRLAEPAALERRDALDVAAQVAEALVALHARGVAYGALVPGNVLLDGLAVTLGPAPRLGVAAGGPPGVPPRRASAFVAPEALGGAPPAPPGDVWSLGVLVCCLLGVLPADTLVDDVDRARLAMAMAAAVARTPGGPDLADLVARALEPRATVRATSAWCLAALQRAAVPAPPAAAPQPSEADAEPAVPRLADDDVRFTVYCPPVVPPGTWTTLAVYAHKTDPFVDPRRGPVDPAAEVRELARRLFGDTGAFTERSAESRADLPRGAELRFVAVVEGGQVNPRSVVQNWEEPIHEVRFRFRIGQPPPSGRARGLVSIYLGVLLVGEVAFSVGVASDAAERRRSGGGEPVGSSPMVRVFPSYSHLDVAVVERVEAAVRALGHDYLRDTVVLRSGEVYEPRLEQLIDDATIFQLFWSHNAMDSAYVRREYEHALALGRPGFVRPVYWEQPVPEDPGRMLPPPELRRLHFAFLGEALSGERGPASSPPVGSAPVGSAPVATAPVAKPPAPAPVLPATTRAAPRGPTRGLGTRPAFVSLVAAAAIAVVIVVLLLLMVGN